MTALTERSSAVISDCGRYRYRLDRVWDDGLPTLTWVMLNPSTADAEQDDPTIRRVRRFSKEWGYGGFTVVNVYAWRATKPSDLPDSDVVAAGPLWQQHFTEAVESAPVVVAWGARGASRACQDLLGVLLRRRSLFGPPLCLGVTKDGHPRHPLYVPADTIPVPFEEARS